MFRRLQVCASSNGAAYRGAKNPPIGNLASTVINQKSSTSSLTLGPLGGTNGYKSFSTTSGTSNFNRIIRSQQNGERCIFNSSLKAAAKERSRMDPRLLVVAAAAVTASIVSCDSPSPFLYPELLSGIKRREASEKALRDYVTSKRSDVEEIRKQYIAEMKAEGKEAALAKYQDRMTKLKEEVSHQTQIILYGVDVPHARQKYLDQYGCARWTAEAISEVKKYSPIIEIGAGSGHWQEALHSKGVDVLAYDDQSTLRPSDKPAGKVENGNEKEIIKHPRRTLFLCYPPDNNMAYKCLELYTGEFFIFVGEGRGGVNANKLFFDAVEKSWDCVHVSDLDPFPECFEKLFVFRRKK